MLHEQLLPGIREYVNGPKFKQALQIPESIPVDVRFLAQGEYNINYLLEIPEYAEKASGQDPGRTGRSCDHNFGRTEKSGAGRRLVFRVNTGSQMNLSNQIRYEYQALELLQNSGVTPVPLYIDDLKQQIPYGCLAMEYLPGEPLDYGRDLSKAAEVFARIHSLPLKPEQTGFLLQVEGPFSVICREVEWLLKPYLESPAGDPEVKSLLEDLYIKSMDKRQEEKYFAREPWRAVINSEVNSHNFIVNRERDTCHLIDWEKPIYGEPAQDLSMFLIPTTTLWKRNVILNPEQEETFLRCYLQVLPPSPQSRTLRERVQSFKFFNLLRAISWCAMAWTEYTQPGRPIVNMDTFAKIKMYIEPEFIKESFSALG